MNKFFALFLTILIFMTTGNSSLAVENDSLNIFDYTRPMSEEKIAIYDNYVMELYEATKIAYKNYKFKCWPLKFECWEASATLDLNKDGVIESYLLQTHLSKVYTLIDGQYVETEDLDKKHHSMDTSQVYFSYDRYAHPIRRKVHFKYRDEFHDRIRNFIENEIHTKPFPKEFIHDGICIRITLYYFPLDGIRYHGTKIVWKLDKKHGPINSPKRIPTKNGYIFPKPPSWGFALIKN